MTLSELGLDAVTDAGHDLRRVLAEAGDHPLMYSFPQGAVFVFDHDLRYLSAGGLGLTEVGLSRELLEGRTIYEAFDPETADLIAPHYRAALAGTSTSWDVPYAGRLFAQRLSPLSDRSGRVVAGLGFTQDVTEARAAEQALRESEQRNRLTFENAPIGKALVELDGRWRQVNAAITRLTGYSEQELRGMTFQDITHPDDLDLDLDHLHRLTAGEIASYQIEKRYFTASGRIVHVLLSVSLVRDDDGAPLYFISQIQDITERKRQQEALRDLTAMLAHDLRTPAAVIGGFAEMLASGDPMGDDDRRDFAGRIRAAADSMTALLENALTTTSLDSGELTASPEPVDVSDVVAQVVGTLQETLPVVDLRQVQDGTCWVDRTHLVQVLTNLLTNAAKYGGDQIAISARASHGEVSIADNGPGVEPDFVRHLFERRTRSGGARSGSQRGSGLGLYIARDLLTLNGGSVRYRPRAGGGSDFVVHLPTAPATLRA